MKASRVALCALTCAALSAPAWAGRANDFETTVDMAAGVAFGSLYDTRKTADNVQYISCAVAARAGSDARVTCLARSTTAGPLSCSSTRPELVAIGAGLTDNGYARFECVGSELTYLYVSKGSLWLP
jgi:hypothetical protein